MEHVQSVVIDMRKLFFIDSENVGDCWISLLDTVAEDDEILVFYTAKSPHMNYKNLILLKNSSKEVEFIECCEGNNALDFQLCTELGFRISGIKDDVVYIVSNDTGYDAVVKYWKNKNIAISRIKGSECAASQAQKAKKTTAKAAEEKKPLSSKEKTSKKASAGLDTNEMKAREIFYCIGKDSLQDLHTALQQFFGNKEGKNYYDRFKKPDSELNSFIDGHIKLSPDEKRVHYCLIVFELSSPKIEMPKDFPGFVTETWRNKKNLNSFRAALLTKYGKDKYEKYYSLIKAHIKILDDIK